MNPSDQPQLVIDIEQFSDYVLKVSLMRGRDPADAMMMMLVGACQLFREYANEADDLGAIHEALDKAFEAARSWWVPDGEEGETLQ